MPKVVTDKEYFRYMEADIFQNPESSWLEVFCQRAMMIRGYSVRNVARILAQFPQATYVAGRQQYEESGIYVLNGATAIRIYAPLAKGEQKTRTYSAVDVYDISQTSARHRRTPRQPSPAEHLKKVCLLAKAAGLSVVSADLVSGAWKVLEGNVLYIKDGIPTQIAAQLVAQELLRLAIEQEHPELAWLATQISVVASYALEASYGYEVPPLAHTYKMTLCTNGRLLTYVDIAVRTAKRMARQLKKM